MLGAGSAALIKETIRDPDVRLYVPALCDVEVAAGLRRAVRRKELSEVRALDALDDYEALPLNRHGHLSLLRRIFELRNNFSAYDAAYVALAERLGGDLLSADQRLKKSVLTHTTIRVLP